ncbi:Gfo/Idh/MocA family protein [Cytobacillus sp. Hz8]|uniref:Gfo/Idh/MocA family protein n=1 Tax=Cytobacillus sp. Hz8 TaxID=3347168 RepID=UPI0035DB1640
MLNWGIVGTGVIANEFAQQFLAGNANLYGVSSKSEIQAKQFAGKYNIEKVFATNDELINEPEVDVVYIAVPHNIHYELIMQSLKAKKHVVCEKLITISKEQLDKATELANKNNVLLFEAMTIHYMPLYTKLNEWIKAHDLGPLKMVQVNFGSFKTFDQSRYFFNKDLAGGALFDIGVYALNFTRWFLTSKPEEIDTLGNIHTSTGVDESSVIILRNKEKELASISLTFRAKMPKQGVVAFENGYFTITNYPRADKAIFTDLEGNVTIIEEGQTAKGLAYEVEKITDLILYKKENPNLQYTLDVLEIMDNVRNKWGLHYLFEHC